MPDKGRSSDAGAIDQRMMNAAIRIGAGALGTTWPNPAVGAVLVKHGQVRAVGRTAPGGRPHAEQQALAAAGTDAVGATLYVSLEPCVHHGKTPPCADALIAAGISRVVIGTIDPDDRVSGQGIAALEAAGITCELVGQACARKAHAGHISRAQAGRPWITLKMAVSGDGMIGRETGGQVAITGKRASRHVHALRSRYDAILVGRRTVQSDNPKLTCRLPGLEKRSPVRIVLDTKGQLKPDAAIFAADNVPVIRLVGKDTEPDPAAAFADHVETIAAPVAGGGLDLAAAMNRLAEYGLTRVLVEGGAHVAASLVTERLIDDVILFRSPAVIGAGGIPALAGLPLSVFDDEAQFRMTGRRRFGDDLMVRYRKVE